MENENAYILKKTHKMPWTLLSLEIYMLLVIPSIIVLIMFLYHTFSIINMILCVLIFLVPLLMIYYTKFESSNQSRIKRIGKKQVGYITEVGYQHGNQYRFEDYYMYVTYQDKKIKVSRLSNNHAYKILKLLLEPYPVKENVKIPVDIYVYKNKIYVDFQNVEFSKIEGYEEAKKIVEETYPNL